MPRGRGRPAAARHAPAERLDVAREVARHGTCVYAVGDAVGDEVPRPPHGRAPTALCLRPLNAIGRHEMCHGWRAAVESEDRACVASRTLRPHSSTTGYACVGRKAAAAAFGLGAMW